MAQPLLFNTIDAHVPQFFYFGLHVIKLVVYSHFSSTLTQKDSPSLVCKKGL